MCLFGTKQVTSFQAKASVTVQLLGLLGGTNNNNTDIMKNIF